MWCGWRPPWGLVSARRCGIISSTISTTIIRTYSKRPIYWQVSSPKGGFNALVYLHRYTPATLGVVHQNFAEEMLGKVQARVETIEHALLSAGKREAVGLGKERDALAAQRREVEDWIDSALFPLSPLKSRWILMTVSSRTIPNSQAS